MTDYQKALIRERLELIRARLDAAIACGIERRIGGLEQGTEDLVELLGIILNAL